MSKKKGVTAPAPGAPVQPKKREKPDKKLRRVTINQLQAVTLKGMNDQLVAAQKADAGIIRAETQLSAYFAAILHGAGETKNAGLVGVEKGIGSKYVLKYRLQ